MIILSEQPVGGAVEVHEVVEIGPHAAKDAKDHLDEEGRLDQALIDEPFNVVELAKVVALELKLRAVGLAQICQGVFDGGEGVGEDEIPGHAEKFGFPKRGVLKENVLQLIDIKKEFYRRKSAILPFYNSLILWDI